MQLLDGQWVYSATDVVNYIECVHKVEIERARAAGLLDSHDRPSADEGAQLAAQHGLAHEGRYVGILRSQGFEVVEIAAAGGPGVRGLMAGEQATRAAMARGVDVIFQAVMFDGTWLGKADFLVKVPTPSNLGDWSYEAHDTKLARTTKVAALVQLAIYSEALERLQGQLPQNMHVVRGDLSIDTVSVADVLPYVRRLRSRFLAAVDSETIDTYPVPVRHCQICAWAPRCEARRIKDDHLSGLPGVRSTQVAVLENAGLASVAALAEANAAPELRGIGASVVADLHTLAQLQVESRRAAGPLHRVKPPSDDLPATGLRAVPPTDLGDLFFDLEGDPYLGLAGREYLWGWCDERGEEGYDLRWGHTEQAEKLAVEYFIDFALARYAQHPGMHIYHYANYEIAALKRLTAQYGTREVELDHLLRGNVFVDLYRVARGGLWVSTNSYSIKALEAFYREARQTDVQSGMASVVQYEKWLSDEDPEILADIVLYNRDDCVSTLELRNWLLAVRPDTHTYLSPPEAADDAAEKVIASDEARAVLVHQLTQNPDDQASWLLAQLLGFHRRESKSEYWWFLERSAMTPAELINDSESIGGLEYVGEQGSVDRSTIYRFRFDATQDHKLSKGSKPVDPASGKGFEIYDMDSRAGWLDLKRGRAAEPPAPEALIPGKPISTKALEDALMEVGEWVVNNGISGPGPFSAGRQLLLRRPPAIVGHPSGSKLVADGEATIDAITRLARNLKASYLAVQGPPGSGKTHCGAAMVRSLVADGKRVGIVANSHSVVANFLVRVLADGPLIGDVVKVGGPELAAPIVWHEGNSPAVRQSLLDPAGSAVVVGGTAWLFANEDLRQTFDVLVVDEAAQMTLASVLAASTAAKNLVLLGDPQQLDQPVKGGHPPGSSTSALGHIVGDRATIDPMLGVFLSESWRMAPTVAAAVSELAYDNQLGSNSRCAGQKLIDHGTGVVFDFVDHEGNRRRSQAEANRVKELVSDLLTDQWVDHDDTRRALTLADILVIAPYNAQVQLLQDELGSEARVGTVDKFQGQEAAVVIYSLTASTGDDVPRGFEFLFSRNRLNVAISRAKCLSIVVASPRLLDAKPHTPQQLQLISGICRLAERSIRRPASHHL